MSVLTWWDTNFYIGRQWTESGISYRVVEGDRITPHQIGPDRVLEICTNGFVKPTIAHTSYLVNFKIGLEENNYPRETKSGDVTGNAGGLHLLTRLFEGVLWGTEWVKQTIRIERMLQENRWRNNARRFKVSDDERV